MVAGKDGSVTGSGVVDPADDTQKHGHFYTIDASNPSSGASSNSGWNTALLPPLRLATVRCMARLGVTFARYARGASPVSIQLSILPY